MRLKITGLQHLPFVPVFPLERNVPYRSAISG